MASNEAEQSEATPSTTGFASDRILLDKHQSVSVLPTPVIDDSEVKEVVATTPEPTEPATLSDSDKLEGKEPEAVQEPTPVEPKEDENQEVSSEGSEETKVDEPEEVDIQSFDLPSEEGETIKTTTEDGEPKPQAVFDPQSPLKEDDPKWMHESYQRLRDDAELSDDDKKVISGLPPSSWENARVWNKSHKSLGQFRNPDYPIEQFVDQLEKQSPTRTSDLRLAVISDIVGDSDALIGFAETHPETYGTLMVAMANSQPEFVAKLLQRKGYSVSEYTPPSVDIEEITKMIGESEEWSVLEGTDLEAKIQELLSNSARMSEELGASKNLRAEDVLEKKEEGEQVEEGSASGRVYSEQARVTELVFQGWEQDVKDGIESTGLKPPSEQELKTNPIPSLLRKVAYHISMHGLEGMIPNWQVALFDWGEKNVTGFKSQTGELTDMIKQERESEATSYARSLAPHSQKFGRLRASVPAIKALLKLAEAEEKRRSESPVEGQDTVTVRGGQGQPDLGGAPASPSGFSSDALILGRGR